MGGNALKKVVAARMDQSTYSTIETIILSVLKQYYSECSSVINRPEKEKDGHGDMDILYLGNNINILDVIIKEFNPIEYHKNGTIYSIAYKHLDAYHQIDLILCTSIEQYNASKFYFSYGDLGGILGRMTSYGGIKFGSDGLWLYYFPTGNPCENAIYIHLTYDPQIICKYLNLDYDVYLKGFTKLVDVFDWLIASNYFYINIFDFDTLNHDHKRRTIKRPMYQQFVEGLPPLGGEHSTLNGEDIKKLNKPLDVPHNDYIKKMQNDALNYFEKNDYLKEQLDEIKCKQEFKEKFSGKLFVDLGVNVKLINESIVKFKNHIMEIYKMPFENYIISTSKEDIINQIKLTI